MERIVLFPASMREIQPVNLLRLAPFLTIIATATPVEAIDIQFDYSFDTANFFIGHPERQSVLEAAALTFESRFNDSLSAITPGGSNTWTASFPNPATGTTANVDNLPIGANVILVYAGARQLGTTTLGIGGPGGLSASGSAAFVDTVVLRGQVSGSTDFGPWGGAITFDIDRNWYFDPNPATLESFGTASDFYSVSVHELAHLLGFGTSESWDNLVSGTTFTGAASMAENSGAPVPLTLATSHWAEGTMSDVTSPFTIASQEAAMDPTITSGTRKYFTELDYAALDDIGWQVIPEPGTTFLFATGFGLMAARRRAVSPERFER